MSAGAPERALDLKRLLEILRSHQVEYLVIGGVAVQVHGHRRTTKDLDVLPAPGAENAQRLGAALAELRARPAGQTGDPELPTADAERLAVAALTPPLVTEHGELHVVNEPKGATDWAQMRERALVIDLDGTEVAIVGIDDLVRMKLASGRAVDLEDVAFLTAVERRERDA